MHIENASYSLRAGQAIFIPPNLLHSGTRISGQDEPCSFYAFVFSAEMIRDTAPRLLLYPS